MTRIAGHRQRVAGLLLAFYRLSEGGVVGAVAGPVSQALGQGQRDVTSVTTVALAHFDVVVDGGMDDEAENCSPTPRCDARAGGPTSPATTTRCLD